MKFLICVCTFAVDFVDNARGRKVLGVASVEDIFIVCNRNSEGYDNIPSLDVYVTYVSSLVTQYLLKNTSVWVCVCSIRNFILNVTFLSSRKKTNTKKHSLKVRVFYFM